MSNNPVGRRLVANGIDNSFITNAYLKSHHQDYPFNQVPAPLYWPQAFKFAQTLFRNSLIMMTYLEDQPDLYLSFVVYQYEEDMLVLHYAYTKSDFRHQGLVEDTINLILPNPESKIILTHFPKSQSVMCGFQSKFPHSVFDPFYFTRSYVRN